MGGGVFLVRNEEYHTFSEYMKSNSLTPSEEDYIEMIYRLSFEESSIKLNDISKSLNIKPPSVTKMVKKLDKKNLLIYTKYGDIKLTRIGKIVGKKLLDRHNTIYEFLMLIGVEDGIHEETEKIEHTISVETLRKINKLIDFLNHEKDILEKLRNFKRD